MSLTAPIVSLKNVTYRFGKEAAVENVSFDINTGDYLGVIGPNGSGKTTLLRLILGLIKPQQGNIDLFGEMIDKFSDWKKIGYIPQKVTHFDMPFPISVREIVSQGRVAHVGLLRSYAPHDQDAITHALKMVKMDTLADQKIDDLSGGQQQRVFIARALAAQPKLLILDEPTVGIDLETQEEFYELLSDLNKKENMTIVIVSHDIDVIVNEVNRLACLNRHLVYKGDPKEFVNNASYLKEVYGKNRRFVLHAH